MDYQKRNSCSFTKRNLSPGTFYRAVQQTLWKGKCKNWASWTLLTTRPLSTLTPVKFDFAANIYIRTAIFSQPIYTHTRTAIFPYAPNNSSHTHTQSIPLQHAAPQPLCGYNSRYTLYCCPLQRSVLYIISFRSCVHSEQYGNFFQFVYVVLESSFFTIMDYDVWFIVRGCLLLVTVYC